jgi:hypothetical protein
MTPDEADSESPAGKAPLVTNQLIGLAPETVSVVE